MSHCRSGRSYGIVLVGLLATALGVVAMAAPPQDVAEAPSTAAAAGAAIEKAVKSAEQGAIIKDIVRRSASLLLGAGRRGLAPHPRVERMSLDEQVEFASQMAAQGLLEYCDPIWICNLGCRVASNRCLPGADRREARCAGEISTRCALSSKCRERHLRECREEANKIRGQCMASTSSCITCCYNSREAAFDALGINQCVAKELSIGTQTPTSSSAGGQIVH